MFDDWLKPFLATIMAAIIVEWLLPSRTSVLHIFKRLGTEITLLGRCGHSLAINRRMSRPIAITVLVMALIIAWTTLNPSNPSPINHNKSMKHGLSTSDAEKVAEVFELAINSGSVRSPSDPRELEDGDVNGNGVIDFADVVDIYQSSSPFHLDEATRVLKLKLAINSGSVRSLSDPRELEDWDVNGNGVIDFVDVVDIYQSLMYSPSQP